MSNIYRIWLLAEGILFFLAASIHMGHFLGGYEHFQAGTAETVIGVVLLIGMLMTFPFPASTRGISLTVQVFALLGTAVGATMILIGVGPQTAADRIYHVILFIVLITGFIRMWRGSKASSSAARGFSAGF